MQRQERTWTVYPDGIAEVRVKLAGVECDDGLVLALPEKPYCAIAYDDAAIAPGAVKVERESRDGRTRFRLTGNGPFANCEWGYTISNALALDAFDVEHLHPVPNGAVGLPPGTTGRPHVVRFENGHLRLAYEFADDRERHAGPIVRGAQAVVEARREEHGFEWWERVRDEEDRCEVVFADDGRSASLDVPQPVTGYRYTLAYTPAPKGHTLSPEAIEHASELLDRCRGSYAGQEGIVRRFTDDVAQALADCDIGPLGNRSSWLGFIWNDRKDKKLLLPCFGRFTSQQWSVRFPYGGGVAGHAFRFSKVALWSHGLTPPRSVIFQQQTDAGSNYTHDYRWIVSVPLLLRPGGPAIGIVSFASPDGETAGDHWFETLVRDATSEDAERVATARARSDRLLRMVNIHFWSCIKTSPDVTFGLQSFAEAVLLQLDRPSPET